MAIKWNPGVSRKRARKAAPRLREFREGESIFGVTYAMDLYWEMPTIVDALKALRSTASVVKRPGAAASRFRIDLPSGDTWAAVSPNSPAPENDNEPARDAEPSPTLQPDDSVRRSCLDRIIAAACDSIDEGQKQFDREVRACEESIATWRKSVADGSASALHVPAESRLLTALAANVAPLFLMYSDYPRFIADRVVGRMADEEIESELHGLGRILGLARTYGHELLNHERVAPIVARLTPERRQEIEENARPARNATRTFNEKPGTGRPAVRKPESDVEDVDGAVAKAKGLFPHLARGYLKLACEELDQSRGLKPGTTLKRYRRARSRRGYTGARPTLTERHYFPDDDKTGHTESIHCACRPQKEEDDEVVTFNHNRRGWIS